MPQAKNATPPLAMQKAHPPAGLRASSKSPRPGAAEAANSTGSSTKPIAADVQVTHTTLLSSTLPKLPLAAAAASTLSKSTPEASAAAAAAGSAVTVTELSPRAQALRSRVAEAGATPPPRDVSALLSQIESLELQLTASEKRVQELLSSGDLDASALAEIAAHAAGSSQCRRLQAQIVQLQTALADRSSSAGVPTVNGESLAVGAARSERVPSSSTEEESAAVLAAEVMRLEQVAAALHSENAALKSKLQAQTTTATTLAGATAGTTSCDSTGGADASCEDSFTLPPPRVVGLAGAVDAHSSSSSKGKRSSASGTTGSGTTGSGTTSSGTNAVSVVEHKQIRQTKFTVGEPVLAR
jgi:hypothetical protein